MTDTQQLIDQLWDFDDPAASESRFRQAADHAPNQAVRLELLTQVARSQGLQRRFDDAHRTLDEVGAAIASTTPPSHGTAIEARSLLERGRVLNSSGARDQALGLFEQAFDAARRIGDDHLAADAAHMIAIVHDAQRRPEDALEWNTRALRIAESSSQARARQWRGSLHNNIGWTLHDRGDFAAALAHFERALACRVEAGDPREIRIARWCIARCLRSLGRIEQALKIQRQLLGDLESRGKTADGYVHEELGECLLALGLQAEATPHFHLAHQALSQDADLMQREPARIERLRRLAGEPARGSR